MVRQELGTKKKSVRLYDIRIRIIYVMIADYFKIELLDC